MSQADGNLGTVYLQCLLVRWCGVCLCTFNVCWYGGAVSVCVPSINHLLGVISERDRVYFQCLDGIYNARRACHWAHACSLQASKRGNQLPHRLQSSLEKRAPCCTSAYLPGKSTVLSLSASWQEHRSVPICLLARAPCCTDLPPGKSTVLYLSASWREHCSVLICLLARALFCTYLPLGKSTVLYLSASWQEHRSVPICLLARAPFCPYLPPGKSTVLSLSAS
jgi:hypothetical protein